MKSLSREEIIRMFDGGTGGSAGGGSFDPSVLAGYATQLWVDGNYVSKPFFNQLFTVHVKITTVVTDSHGDPVGDPTVTTGVIEPNETVGTTSTTDQTTGYTTTVTKEIASIEANKGFWSNLFISALGQGSGGSGGVAALADLIDVQLSDPVPTGSLLSFNGTKWVNGPILNITNPQNNDVLKYDAATGKWINGVVGGTDMTTVWNALAANTNEQINASHLSTALGGYAKLRSANDMIFSSNEISFVPSQYAGVVHINYRTVTGKDGSITGYNFDDGAGNVLASITNGAFSGNAASATKLATARYLWGRQFDGTADISGRLYLYKPNAGSDTGAVYLEYESNNGGVHLVGAGLYVDTYLSALGLNSGGGGITLNEPLQSINNAGLSAHPSSSGQTVVWNGSSWTYGTAGAGTVTSITAGTGLSGGTITTSGTIGIDSTYQTFIGHGETAYGWGNHADAGYITSSGSCAYASDAGAVSGYTIDKLDKMENLGYVGDYIYSVFLLCKMTVSEYHINGIFYTYANGASRFKCSDIHIQRSYWGTSGSTIGTLVDRAYVSDGHFELCTFTYNGEQWLGVALRRVQACYYVFQGTHNGDAITRVDYYKQNTQEILNSEIYNSISFVNANNIYCNVSSATKLLTARSLWGNSFDGTADINGNITVTKSDTSDVFVRTTNSLGTISLMASNPNRGVWDSTVSAWIFGTNGTNTWLSVGNVGIGTASPAYKLDVNGTARVTDLYIGNIHITYDSTNGGLVIGGGLSATTYLSALGVNSGGGGGGTTLTEPLSSINTAGLGTPSGSNKFLLWNGSAWTYGTYASGTTLNEPLASINALGAPSGSNKILLWNGSAWTYGNQSTGGASSLSQLSDVDSNLNPSNGQALVYNSTSHQWEAQTIGGGSGTLTSIGLVMPTGFSVSPATLTANGSFTVSFASGYSLPSTSSQSHWDTAYTFASNSKFGTAGTDYIPITLGSTTKNVLTAHQSLSDYYTKSQSDSRYLQGITSSMVTSALGFTPVSNATTWWGRSISSGTVTGDMSSVGSIEMSSILYMANGQSISFKDTGGTYRNVMTFNASNLLAIGYHVRQQGYTTDIQGGTITFGVGTSRVEAMDISSAGLVRIIQGSQGLQIGDARLIWDSTNNALKVTRYSNGSEVACNLYATGGVSALGLSGSGGATISNMVITNTLYFNDDENGGTIDTMTGDLMIGTHGNSGWVKLDDMCSSLGANYWKIQTSGHAQFQRLYLDNSRYIYIDANDGNKLKYYDGSTSRTIQYS